MRIKQITQKSNLSAKRSTSLHHCWIRCTLTPNFLYGFKLCYVIRYLKKYFSANPWYRKFEKWPTLKKGSTRWHFKPNNFFCDWIFCVGDLTAQFRKKKHPAEKSSYTEFEMIFVRVTSSLIINFKMYLLKQWRFLFFLKI